MYSNKAVLTWFNVGQDQSGAKGEAHWICCQYKQCGGFSANHEEEGEENVSPRNVSFSESSPSFMREKMTAAPIFSSNSSSSTARRQKDLYSLAVSEI